VPTGDGLYELVNGILWEEWISPKHTLAVAAVGRSDELHHSGFVALKAKDAIVDRFRERVGSRPSVDLNDPDLRIVVYVTPHGLTIYIDLAGESLHRRGYRIQAGVAPLRETVAAAGLLMAGWDGTRSLLDPFCGSGTLVIEAGLIAHGVAPGLLRRRFGFQRWLSFDGYGRKEWDEMVGFAHRMVRRDRRSIPPIFGSDIDPEMVKLTDDNAARAGIPLYLRVQPVSKIQPLDPPGMVICNPPYGTRLEPDEQMLSEAREALLGMGGHRIVVLAGSEGLRRLLPIRPTASHAVANGALDCHWVIWDVDGRPRQRRVARAEDI